MKTLTIKRRLLAISIFIVIGMLFFLFFAYNDFTTSLENERKSQTKYLSSSAMGIIQYFHNLELAGELNSSQAQEFAMRALEAAIYGDKGYFWNISSIGKLLMHPYSPESVGVNFMDRTDSNGKYFVREFLSKAQSGGGWVTYTWPKPGTTNHYTKISYVNYFRPWDWVFGTGVYLDDMHNSIFWIVVKSSGILFGIFFVFLVGAISLINISTKKLEELAIRDALTGLYTKRLLFEIIPDILRKQFRQREKALAVIFMDIDHFKNVNDSYGHSVGDEVLQSLGKVILNETRPGDYCVRYGGEEIIVVGFYVRLEAAAEVADRIRIAFGKQSFVVDGSEFSVTVSAGISIYNCDSESFEETIERADKKLYESKASGRNRITS